MHVHVAYHRCQAGVPAGKGIPLATLDLAPKLGSGTRFKKLSAKLAARGAHNPDALAAWIGRRKYGGKAFSKLSHHKHANPDLGIYLAETARDAQGLLLTCPECNYTGPAGRFGASGTSLETSPEILRTPGSAGNVASTGFKKASSGVVVRSNPGRHALANPGGTGVNLAGTAALPRRPVQGPVDVLVARRDDGTAILRHRNGGAEIAALRKTPAGKWVATVNGTDLTPRDHQRTALMEAVGTWNSAVRSAVRPQDGPLQPPPQQTELMAEYGIPAIRVLATPAAGADAGPRVTLASDGGTSGLSPRGQEIYRKLKARGFPDKRALAFAKNSEHARPGRFAKA